MGADLLFTDCSQGFPAFRSSLTSAERGPFNENPLVDVRSVQALLTAPAGDSLASILAYNFFGERCDAVTRDGFSECNGSCSDVPPKLPEEIVPVSKIALRDRNIEDIHEESSATWSWRNHRENEM
jgi:hypothetical protein